MLMGDAPPRRREALKGLYTEKWGDWAKKGGSIDPLDHSILMGLQVHLN